MDDLEYREERSETKQPIKKNIPLKLKSGSAIQVNAKSSIAPSEKAPSQTSESPVKSFELKTPNKNEDSFKNKPLTNTSPKDSPSYAKKNHSASSLNWNLSIASISQKEKNQTMDLCMICNLPILIYGRLIPCKHVMCIQCANRIEIKICLKESCNEEIERIEPVVRGRIFVCQYDLDFRNSSFNLERFRLNPDISQKKICGRSYMSQRDLNSHIQHRHETVIKME